MDGRDRQTGPGKAGRKAEQAERLAAALRENLRRRKAQARARQGGGEASGEAAEGPGRNRPGTDDETGNTG